MLLGKQPVTILLIGKLSGIALNIFIIICPQALL